MTPVEKFYHNVQVEATKKGKNLLQLSIEMGKTPSALSTKKSKKANPTLTTILDIAKAIGCPVKNLLDGM